MAIPKNLAIRQMVRLSILRGFPPDGSAAQVELLKALSESSENDGHCARMVDAWLRESPFSPTPSEIYGLANVVPCFDSVGRPDRRCAACSGTGYEHVWRLTTYSSSAAYSHRSEQIVTDEQAKDLGPKLDGKAQRIDSCVRRCQECNYGRALAVAERLRRAS